MGIKNLKITRTLLINSTWSFLKMKAGLMKWVKNPKNLLCAKKNLNSVKIRSFNYLTEKFRKTMEQTISNKAVVEMAATTKKMTIIMRLTIFRKWTLMMGRIWATHHQLLKSKILTITLYQQKSKKWSNNRQNNFNINNQILLMKIFLSKSLSIKQAKLEMPIKIKTNFNSRFVTLSNKL